MLPADSPFASLPSPGPHPATAELRAYAAGTLNPADEHRIEAHTLDCERCAELLEGFSMSDAATTDRAVAELRTRLQARVGQPAKPVAAGWAWPRMAAAAALLAAVGAGIWGWQHQALAPAPTQVATSSPTGSPAATAPAVASITPAKQAPAAIPAPDAPDRAALPTTAPAASKAARPTVAYARPSSARRPFATPSAGHIIAMEQAEDAKPAAAVADAVVSKADEQRNEPIVASAPVAPAASRETAPPANAVADSVPSRNEATVASRFSMAKAKAAPANAAALVANTPMPAAAAIAPAPVTGTPALHAYLRNEAAKFELEEGAKPLTGAVRVRFIVGADGKLSNLQVVRSLRADYDEEALRLLCEGPAWRPGIAGGRRAALPVEVTVSF